MNAQEWAAHVEATALFDRLDVPMPSADELHDMLWRQPIAVFASRAVLSSEPGPVVYYRVAEDHAAPYTSNHRDYLRTRAR